MSIIKYMSTIYSNVCIKLLVILNAINKGIKVIKYMSKNKLMQLHIM